MSVENRFTAIPPDKKGGTGWSRRSGERALWGTASATLGARSVAGALSMPGDVGRVLVRLLVDIGHARDADHRQENDSAGKSPTAVDVGANVAINVLVGHRIPVESPSS